MIWLFITIFGLLGIFVGSLWGTAAFRLATDRPLKGRQSCTVCLEPVHAKDLIPVISYLRLRGRCRSCASAISWYYPVIEISMGIVFAVLAARIIFLPDLWFSVPQEFLGALLVRDLIIAATLILLFAFDVKQYVVPDRISIPAIILVVVMNLLLGLPWISWVLGAIIGGLFFGIQYAVSGGSLVGGGDMRVGILIGLALGFPGALEAIVLAYILASIVAIPLYFSGKINQSSKAPFVAFLATSTIVLLCLGPILNPYFYQLFS